MNDHFLQTGNNQPNIPLDTVPPCYSVSSNNSDGAYVRAKPDTNSTFYKYAYNGYQLTLNCWVYGVWADGNYSTNVWYAVPVPNNNSGLIGYINASLVNPVPVFPPPCPFTP